MNNNGWMPIESAPKGEPRPYGSGPQILGAKVGEGWQAVNIVSFEYHKNPAKGSWKGPNAVWEPDFWQPLPAPPTGEDA